jgi:hypothetical protein
VRMSENGHFMSKARINGSTIGHGGHRGQHRGAQP